MGGEGGEAGLVKRRLCETGRGKEDEKGEREIIDGEKWRKESGEEEID